MQIKLNKMEIDILLNGLLALNHRLLDELVMKGKSTEDYRGYEQVKERIIAVNFLIDKITNTEDLKND